MSIIEQAAKRLEALRRAGIEPGVIRDGAGKAASVGGLASAQEGVVKERAASSDKSRRVELNLSHLAAEGFLTPEGATTALAEQFRLIKRPLLSNVSSATVPRANLIMVTSALADEGKTFVAINLALSMAMELDRRVLLVDGDVRRPSIMTRLGLVGEPGLMDVLEDGTRPVSDVLLQTNIDKLALLPAGCERENATEYLSSNRLHRLLDDLCTRYADRILIVDTPPVLLSTESRVLAANAGQVVLVVAEGQTPVASVTEALATLNHCAVVLPVLNKARRLHGGVYGGYYPRAAQKE